MLSTANSVCASIVLYKTPMAEVAGLISELSNQGVAKVYVVDNSPRDFDTLGNSPPAANCEYIRTGANLGYGRGHNLAIERSSRSIEYYLICNPDIALSAGVIGEMVDYMNAHPDVGLAMPKLIGTDGELQHCCRRSPVAWDYVSQVMFPNTYGRRRAFQLEMRDCDYTKEMEVPCVSGCFMFFRASVLRKLGGFDERFFLYFEDFDLSLRAQKLARNVYVPDCYVVHARRSAHRTSWRLRTAFGVSAMRYFFKWGVFGFRDAVSKGRSIV